MQPSRKQPRRTPLPRQPLIRHPVRVERVGAHAAHLVLLVIFEIALEPFDVAVALEGMDARALPGLPAGAPR